MNNLKADSKESEARATIENSEPVAAEETKPADNLADEQKETDDRRTVKKYSDADVDEIINKKFAKWEKREKERVEKARADEREAEKLAAMDAKQQLEYKLEKAESRAAELESKMKRAEMEKTAREMLAKNGITNVPDSILSNLVDASNADKTAECINSFSSMFKTMVSESVKNSLHGSVPKTGSASRMSKEEILSIKDTATRQKAISENIDLFRNGNR